MTTIVNGEQGLAATHTGVLSIRTAFEGSKSERPQPFLEVAEGLVPVFLKGDNPFSNAGLQPFLNKRVTCTGAWHRQTFVVSEIVEDPEGTSEVEVVEVVEVIESIQTDLDGAQNPESSADQSIEETVVDEDASSEE
tara:strand:+ start:174 stop:584 length:411 start_codon:yes stop_codon:yes gene_type:complete